MQISGSVMLISSLLWIGLSMRSVGADIAVARPEDAASLPDDPKALETEKIAAEARMDKLTEIICKNHAQMRTLRATLLANDQEIRKLQEEIRAKEAELERLLKEKCPALAGACSEYDRCVKEYESVRRRILAINEKMKQSQKGVGSVDATPESVTPAPTKNR